MLAQGLPVSSRNQTLRTFLTSWLEVIRHRIRPSTYDTYELNIRRISAQLGAVPLVRLSPPGIQDAYGRLSAQGLSDYSVLQVHRTLHRALDRAFRWGLIPRNPASLVLPPRPRKREMTALTSEQLLRLLASTRGERMHALFGFYSAPPGSGWVKLWALSGSMSILRPDGSGSARRYSADVVSGWCCSHRRHLEVGGASSSPRLRSRLSARTDSCSMDCGRSSGSRPPHRDSYLQVALVDRWMEAGHARR